MSSPDTALATVDKRYDDADFTALGLPTPGSLNALKIFAKEAQGTPFFPKGLGTNPNVIWAVILRGKEDGFTPMTAMAAYWLSPDNRLGMYADSMLSKMRKHGFRFTWHEASSERCKVTALRPAINGAGEPESYSSEFTIEEATVAGLAGKDNWRKYPQRMLKARVISDIYRYLASDLGGAGMYSAEEIQDLSDYDAREQAETAADARAEEDPGLRLVPKATATATVEVKAEPAKPEPAKAQDPPPAPARKPTPPKPAAPPPVKEPEHEPEPVSKPTEEAHTSMMALNARALKVAEQFRNKGACELLLFSKMYMGYYGGKSAEMPKTWEPYHHVLDMFEQVIDDERIELFVSDPEKFGKKLRATEEKAKAAVVKPAEPSKPVQETASTTASNEGEKQAVAGDDPLNALGWSEETVKIANTVMSKYKIDPSRIAKTLQVFGIKDVPEVEVATALTLWYHNPDALLLRRRGMERGFNMMTIATMVTDKLGFPVDLNSNSAEVSKAISSVLTEVSS